jgi:hypothetical protein
MKNNKGIILVGAMIAMVIIAYIITTIIKKNNANKTDKTGADSTSKGQVASKVVKTPDRGLFTIKRGSNNDAVKYVKMALNYIAQKKNIPGVNLVLTTDANLFGAATEAALYKIYGVKTIDKVLAQRMANDAGLSEFAIVLNYFK